MEERNNIIINEIKKWQENKLLPDTYCQFLLQLYTEGEAPASDDGKTVKRSFIFRYLTKAFLSLMVMIGIFVLVLVMIYFTQVSPGVQVIFLFIFLMISLVGAIFYNKRNMLVSHLYVILAAFISFVFIIASANLMAPENTLYLAIGIITLCCIWIITGWRFKYHYLYIAGGTGILLFIALIILGRI
ncbi:hypothetical protein HXA31_04790 [Salipaludibacillus agaradhaerens]|uniref:Uncharacterized protein n=1 Tax=Salipaludibacillus agaradhaerens TaxID=76935 RepID=A0A9Q4FZG2_SALAG|nr:hypothetical protein [Salipaludibacillus agaradhaerens]MCR6096768.1 hypothetical protein [Salipaludibacillus agaradhaerens]MCR6113673.1 hypothetical protein [Salipaludibacillus agaradhaerens]